MATSHMHSKSHVLFNHTLVLVFIDIIMDIKIFLFIVLTNPGHYNLKKSTNHSTAVIPYTVCNFQRVNCHFIHVCMYIVAVGLYTLIIIHVTCCKFTAVKSHPSWPLKNIFATATTLTCQLPGGLKIKLVDSFTSFNRHTIYIHDD